MVISAKDRAERVEEFVQENVDKSDLPGVSGSDGVYYLNRENLSEGSTNFEGDCSDKICDPKLKFLERVREWLLRTDFQSWSKLFLPMELIKWLVVDIARGLPKRPYGVYLYCGLPGQGKTQSMIYHIEEAKRRYEDLKVFTNFGYKDQDGELNSVEDLINAPGNSLLCLDEVQVTFQSRNYQKFPAEVVALLCQQRKLAKQLVCTVQIFEHVDKFFRDLCNYIVQCQELVGNRLFRNKFYYGVEYELIKAKGGLDPLYSRMFVATDKMRDAYDTYKIIDALKKTEGSGGDSVRGSSIGRQVDVEPKIKA